MSVSGFYKETEDIYRLTIPFDTVYTSIFLIKSPSVVVLVDCGSTSEDVDEYIVPALFEIGYSLSEITAIVLTHMHGDHAGGLSRMLELAPNITVIRSVCALSDMLYTYPMGGHTEDCIGVFDLRSRTLISGDGLQGAGVDKYRCYLKDPVAYLETLERIKKDERIENILFSHAYEPWNSDRAFGRRAVESCLFHCEKYIKKEEF